MTMSAVRHFVHPPTGPLEGYVREILWLTSERPRRQILLPETTLTLAFRQTGSVWLGYKILPSAVISGLQQQARLTEHEAGSSLIIVRFTEFGAAAFLHDRVDLLYNQTAPLDAFVPRQNIESLQNRLADHSEIPDQILAVEHFLTARLRAQDCVSPPIEAALQMMRHSEDRSSMAAIARQVAMSQSTFERRFRAAIGTSPKTFRRLVRLQHVCRLWDTGKSLTEITFEAGYYDQSHFVQDFRLFTGMAPERFFRSVSPRNLPTFYK